MAKYLSLFLDSQTCNRTTTGSENHQAEYKLTITGGSYGTWEHIFSWHDFVQVSEGINGRVPGSMTPKEKNS